MTPDIELVVPSQPQASRGDDDSRQVLPETRQPRLPSMQVEQGRCAALHKASDPALSCALAYLQAGDMDLFLAKLAGQQP